VRSLEALSRCFAGLALVTAATLAACESSSSNAPTATFGSDASFGDSATPGDAERADAATAADAAADSARDSAAGDPFEGVWVGIQSGATIEISNAAGCTVLRGSVGGTLCDECVGTYVAGDGGVASTVAKCLPVGACSVSPAHTNTGTYTPVDGGALSYFYDYGFGTASVDVQRTASPPGDVCRIVDAGGGD
jgi:hypothetical protein